MREECAVQPFFLNEADIELILKALGPRSDPLGLDNDLQYSTRSTVNPSQSNATKTLK